METLVTAAADDEVSPQNLTQSTPDNRQLVLQPRLIRQRDAPDYLGMDRNKFNEMVRPYLT